MPKAYSDKGAIVQQQVDSVTIIANPVSGTRYPWRAGATGAGAELGTQKNVRIIGIQAFLTWADNQPTPLEVHVTTTLVPFTFSFVNPISVTSYFANLRQDNPALTQPLTTADLLLSYGRWGLLEDPNVLVECEITWAITQPTNLTMRTKWARLI